MDFKELKESLELQNRPDLKEKGITLYKGFLSEESKILYDNTFVNMGFTYIDGFLCEPYLMYWVCPEKLSIVSYCEGDLFLSISENKEAFKNDLKGSIECLQEQFNGHPTKEILKILEG